MARRGTARALEDKWAALPTEAERPGCGDLDALPTRRVVALLAAREHDSVAAVLRAAPAIAEVAEKVARALTSGGRLLYVGAGSSGRLGVLDASECPPTFGTAASEVAALIAGGAPAITRAVEGAEDDEQAGAAAVRSARAGKRDVVVGIAASGTTAYVRGALAAARARKAFTALVTCAPAAAKKAGFLADVVDITVGLAVGPEVLAGSTRLGAGTATKIALNAITTAAMVRAGRVYGSSMVDVRATNAKLRARARRLVVRHTGLASDAADALLLRAGGEVKVAIVMARLEVSRPEAVRRLRAAQGRLRAVVGPP